MMGPQETADRFTRIIDAWGQYAPDRTFGGLTPDQFKQPFRWAPILPPSTRRTQRFCGKNDSGSTQNLKNIHLSGLCVLCGEKWMTD